MFATVPGCSRIACKSTRYTLSIFLVVRRRSWRVGVLIGVLKNATSEVSRIRSNENAGLNILSVILHFPTTQRSSCHDRKDN